MVKGQEVQLLLYTKFILRKKTQDEIKKIQKELSNKDKDDTKKKEEIEEKKEEGKIVKEYKEDVEKYEHLRNRKKNEKKKEDKVILIIQKLIDAKHSIRELIFSDIRTFKLIS